MKALKLIFQLGCVAGAVLALTPLPTASAEPARKRGQTFEEARQHWAFQPLREPAQPRVRERRRVQTPVDAFLLARLESQGLSYAPAADRRTWLRRVSLDLTGLPPTTEEIRSFENDRSPGAQARVVDRLLASPRYGERWGRHWLDVARYADTKDLVLLYGRDALRPYAYTYRDYVIRAFNEDLPFNEFVRDQIAADLEQPKVSDWRLPALGFLTLGRLFDNNPHDQIDDQIDTLGRGLLGLTLACTRCHDHKTDALKMADYYGLYGVFASTERPYVLPLIEDPANVPGGAEFEAKLAKARQELEDLIDAEHTRLSDVFRQRIGDYLFRAATTQPDFTETTQFFLSLTPDDLRPGLMQRTRKFLAERLRASDRVFGPWYELAALMEQARPTQSDGTNAPAKPAPSGQLAAEFERLLLEGVRSKRWNPLVVSALARAKLNTVAEVAKVYGQLLRDVYVESKKPAADPTPAPDPDRQELLAVVTGPEGPVWFSRRDTQMHMSRPEKDKYGGLVLNLDKLAAHATNSPPARAMVVRDLPEPYEPRIFQRGSPARPGEKVSRSFLRVLQDGKERPFRSGSGRLELADAIVDPTNPLTARVFVNRVWMHHFGEPLVASPGDFGSRTEPPTHPELLDWLAASFIRSGWSVKQLHRWIVLSGAYQQSSVGSTDSQSLDPDNRLYSHFNRRRLDLEAMRDTLLFISGRLDPSMGGRPVDVAGDPTNTRRTVYGLVDRQNLPGLFRSFDFAIPDSCVERRPKTTVPQQALFLLNSPFVLEQARALATHPDVTRETEPARRVEALVRRVLARPASSEEIARGVQFIRQSDSNGTESSPPWEQLAQVLLATNELVFVD